MAATQPTWDEVLDAVADDVQRAAELLFDDPARHADSGRIVAPVTLPELTEMPPVPRELRERIEQLRGQIADLQGQLSEALAESQRICRPRLSTMSSERPLYVDRRV